MENTVNFSAPVYDFQNTRNFEELTHRDFHGVQNLKSTKLFEVAPGVYWEFSSNPEKRAEQLEKYLKACPTGKVVCRYVNPSISVKVARIHNTEEDIVILTMKFDDVLTGEIISQDYFARENATKEDLVALFPEYKETMSRDELNKLAPTKVKDFGFRVGIYRVLGEDGKPMRDDAGNSLVQMSTKWLSLTLANGKEFALSGGKREYQAQ